MSQPNYPPPNPQQQPYPQHPQQPPPHPQPGAAAVPPPVPPIQPTYSSCNHVLHLILSLLTVGFWAVMVWPWVYIAVTVNNKNKRTRYEEDLKAYNRDYWQWQQSQSR